MACGILVPCPGIKLVPSAGEVQNLFFFLLLKALLFPFGPRLGRGLQGVKKLPSGCREGLQVEALALWGSFWLQRLLVMLEGEPFKDTHPVQPGDQPT